MSTTATRPSTRGAPAAPRLTLANAIKGGKGLPSRVIFHGQAGIGKSSFAAHTPAPLFLLSPGETGIHTLIDAGQVGETPSIEVQQWEQLPLLIDELTTGEHQYKTLVIDTLDGFEKVGKEFVCRTMFNGDWSSNGYASYAAGDRALAGGPWREFLASLDKLREIKRISILCLAHTGIGTHKNPTGSDYNRWIPDMYKDAWALAYGWCDICIYGYREVLTIKGKDDSRAKGRGSDVRIMATQWDAAWDAKNRHGLPEEIEMGASGSEAWGNFINALKAGKEKK